MGGSSQTPATQQTTQTKDPWSVAQPYLSNTMANAQALGGTGYLPYSGPTVAPFDSYGFTQKAINSGANQAIDQLGGSANLQAARGLSLANMQQEGLNEGLRTAAGQFGDIYSRAQGNENPYLQSIIDTSNRRIGDKIGSSMSGAGRYGSGQHTDVAARAMAEAADPILAQDYQQRQALQMQATGALTDLYGGGLDRAFKVAQNTPALDAAQWAPADKLASYGLGVQSQDQANLDAAAKLYNAQQAWPWEQLFRQNAVYGGAGALGGTAVTTAPGAQQPSTLQKILGGGLAGAGLGGSFGGPMGAGIGAAGGGLLGLLG